MWLKIFVQLAEPKQHFCKQLRNADLNVGVAPISLLPIIVLNFANSIVSSNKQKGARSKIKFGTVMIVVLRLYLRFCRFIYLFSHNKTINQVAISATSNTLLNIII